MRIMPVGVHVDVREYADIEKRYPKPPSGAAAVRSWRHERRARAESQYMLIVTHVLQPPDSAYGTTARYQAT